MSPAADSVVKRLDAARQHWWLFTLLSTSVLAGCVSLGLLLGFMLFDALLTLHQFVLAGLFLVWLAATITLLVTVGRRLVRSQRSLEATARRVEAEFPELGSSLINLIQLAEDTRNEHRAFCDAAVQQAATRIGPMRFEGAAAKKSRWQRLLYCMQTPRDLAESSAVLGLLIVLAIVCQLLIPNWGSAAGRLMKPWTFVPSVGSIQIQVSPGDAEVIVGGSLEIVASINRLPGQPPEATLLVTPEGEAEAALPMALEAKNEKQPAAEKKASEQAGPRYRFTVPTVLKPLTYRLEIGDSQTPVYKVGIREKPTVDEVEVTYDFPLYLNRNKETFKQKQADLEAPQGTVAELKISTSVPVAKGYVQCNAQRYTGTVESGGRLLVVNSMPLLKDATFTIHLFNDAGHTDPDPRANRIHVLPDLPPTVELLKPPRQSTVEPGADVPVMIRAADDHGIGRLWLETKVKSSEAEGGSPAGEGADPETAAPADEAAPANSASPGDTSAPAAPPAPAAAPGPPAKIVQQWTDFSGDTTVVRHYRLTLNPEDVKPGQTVLVRAVVLDRRSVTDWGLDLKAQETASGWHSIGVVAQDAKSTAALEQLDGLRGAIWKILENQIRARVVAATILKKEQLAERSSMAADVRGQQVAVQKASTDLVQSIQQTDKEERLTIKRILNSLAVGDMLQAVRQCDTLAASKAMEDFAVPVPELTAAQDRIIDVLRKLLDVTRQAQSDVLAEMKQRPAGDLPDDTEKALEEARKKLDEFLKQQKKVVEASEDLAKTPVEDFTEKEEQKLKDLAASEDDWTKFMKELHSDLSKLPEQDFANSSLLSELVEIQTELKMAEDALLKKSADIAVPLEQLGYERADEIKTNLEKWLPDTPDRERWSQEESLTDADKEAPMAELPGELEDLIGELMEEEEDLFDEMEDVSSSAADSIDKGAGWDVADGPISNMSAKGATGNRLPNTSEIGGRAGEGRSGKSSGEFVGDEAVGKGGRKTPSRLTPDPYVKGQIKDHSKDPTGGATGGGKESGQGGEGLEGPASRQPGQRELQRLAGKQAALRNKAEGVDLQFQVMNYHHTDLQKMIEMMAQVERDLKSGRYQNALRQRKVVADGLGSVKQYLEGEFEVKQDATANLPAEIQKEILGSMQDPSPTGWEEQNREYFQRLSAGGAAK